MYNRLVGMEVDEIFYPYAKAMYGFFSNTEPDFEMSYEDFHKDFSFERYKQYTGLKVLYEKLPIDYLVGTQVGKMQELGFSPTFVSRRPNVEEIRRTTSNFLWKLGKVYPLFMRSMGGKIDFINSFGFDYFLDTDVNVLRSLKKVHPILYKTCWNETDEFDSVSSINELLSFLIGRERQ